MFYFLNNYICVIHTYLNKFRIELIILLFVMIGQKNIFFATCCVLKTKLYLTKMIATTIHGNQSQRPVIVTCFDLQTVFLHVWYMLKNQDKREESL